VASREKASRGRQAEGKQRKVSRGEQAEDYHKVQPRWKSHGEHIVHDMLDEFSKSILTVDL
jgi:hypothetical protein